jgi:hypothetical protein
MERSEFLKRKTHAGKVKENRGRKRERERERERGKKRKQRCSNMWLQEKNRDAMARKGIKAP